MRETLEFTLDTAQKAYFRRPNTFFSCPFWPFSSFFAASAAYQSCQALQIRPLIWPARPCLFRFPPSGCRPHSHLIARAALRPRCSGFMEVQLLRQLLNASIRQVLASAGAATRALSPWQQVRSNFNSFSCLGSAWVRQRTRHRELAFTSTSMSASVKEEHLDSRMSLVMLLHLKFKVSSMRFGGKLSSRTQLTPRAVHGFPLRHCQHAKVLTS